MSNINNLVKDIQGVLVNGVSSGNAEIKLQLEDVSRPVPRESSKDTPTTQPDKAGMVNHSFEISLPTGPSGKVRPSKTLYASEIGKPCRRQIWYEFYHPTVAEPLGANTLLKFKYGDIIEELVLTLARIAGHAVTHRQEAVSRKYKDWEIRGKVDCLIDEELVDIKSCSPRSFDKIKEGLDDSNDAFGYRAQLAFYMECLGKEHGYFLIVDKVNGKMALVKLDRSSVAPTETTLQKTILELERGPVLSSPPQRHYSHKPHGTSENFVLPVPCSYCPFKKTCWMDSNKGKGLRCFIYSDGPKYFTEIKKLPNVPEVKVV